MNRTKWHGLEQRKAQIKTKRFIRNLSDADAMRMNIKKEEKLIVSY